MTVGKSIGVHWKTTREDDSSFRIGRGKDNELFPPLATIKVLTELYVMTINFSDTTWNAATHHAFAFLLQPA